jgi:dephospho-CoA kinase
MMKICLTGKMATGKTLLAQHFLDNYGGKKVAFADKLKEDVINYKLTIDEQIVKSRDRKLLQNYGQLRRGELPRMEIPEVNIILVNDNGNLMLAKGNSLNHRIWKNLGPCEANHWINQGILKANEIIQSGENVILDDVRFVNEGEHLKANGFIIIKVNANQSIREERLLARDGSFNPDNFNDVSEMQLDNIVGHYDITNNHNDDTAKKQFDEIVALIKN